MKRVDHVVNDAFRAPRGTEWTIDRIQLCGSKPFVCSCLAFSPSAAVFFNGTAQFSPLHAVMSGGPSSSWANIASTAPRPKTASVIEPERILQRALVIDANAIITHQSGLLNLHTQYDRIVTIPEVIAEVRDGQSRQALSTLPFEIEQLTPSEESMRAVGAFARETVRDMEDDAR